MSITIGNGKVIIGDESIQIKKGLLGRYSVVQKHYIESIDSVGGIFSAILLTIIIIGIPRAIPMYMGKVEVKIKTFDEEHVFWLPKNEFVKLKENI